MKRSRGLQSIHSFFKIKKQENSETEEYNNSQNSESETSNLKALHPSVESPTMPISEKQNPNLKVAAQSESSTCKSRILPDECAALWQADQFDIGIADKSRLDDYIKRLILTSILSPKQPFSYPMTEGNNQRRCFQEKWLKDFAFLAYSTEDDGVYCKPCWMFFHKRVGKGGHENPGQLVTSCFRDWKKAKEIFTRHANREYHKDCYLLATNFLEISSGKRQDIMSVLDTRRAREIEENRAALRPIIETLLFCGRQELPLRGDVDSGPLSLTQPEKKDGKFRALLRFRIESGDVNLQKHVLNSTKNATYLSPQIQNEILQICADIIIKKIVSKINNLPCFTLLGDETTDSSGTEQFSICLRYVEFNDVLQKMIIREDFLGFIPIHGQSAENLTKVILKRCTELGLKMEFCSGQGYDGAPNVSGHISGVQSRVRAICPKMLYVHCASHRLNLALSDAMSVPVVRNCLGVVKEVINLFRNHAYANKILRDAIQQFAPESKKKRLTRSCETRFIERHASILTFVELFEVICIGLEKISEETWAISKTASSHFAAVQKSEFIVSLLVCERLFSYTLPLSIILQEKCRDLSSAVEHAERIVNTLKDERKNAKKVFKEIFTAAGKLAEDVFGMQLSVPRITSKQTARANYKTDCVEDYYRVSVFIPCSDTLILNLSEKFILNAGILRSFQILLPGYAANEKAEDLENLSLYFNDRVSLSAVKSENKMWSKQIAYLKKDIEVLEVLEKCDGAYFPTIKYLLTILATMPVTTASVERSFSTLKRIKMFLRSNMGDERLSALAILSIHWDYNVDPDKVLDIMAASKSRRMTL